VTQAPPKPDPTTAAVRPTCLRATSSFLKPSSPLHWLIHVPSPVLAEVKQLDESTAASLGFISKGQDLAPDLSRERK